MDRIVDLVWASDFRRELPFELLVFDLGQRSQLLSLLKDLLDLKSFHQDFGIVGLPRILNVTVGQLLHSNRLLDLLREKFYLLELDIPFV